MSFPQAVKIVEVGPRDGLQNESQYIAASDKIHFINLLSQSGLAAIEVTSFVSEKKIPQLADCHEVFAGIEKYNNVNYTALVPNMQGYEAARAHQVHEVAVFTAASEAFCQRNINCTIAESLQRFIPILEHATNEDVRVRAYISCVLGCPYEDDVSFTTIADIAAQLLDMGCYEVCLGDTTGQGTPLKVQTMIQRVCQHIPREKIALHFHDTYGQAIANIFASLQEGISTFDSSVSGLGGCPYAKGATGNVATEDVVYLLNGLGISHGVDITKLREAGEFIDQCLKRKTESSVARAMRSGNE